MSDAKHVAVRSAMAFLLLIGCSKFGMAESANLPKDEKSQSEPEPSDGKDASRPDRLALVLPEDRSALQTQSRVRPIGNAVTEELPDIPAPSTNRDRVPPNAKAPFIAANTPSGTSTVSGREVRGATSTETLISNSETNTTVTTQQRSAVSFDPRIRGYGFGQILTQTDGAEWSPVRQDLDTMLSKVDPALVDNVVVIPGPYGVSYGPGLSFLDVQTSRTPRNADGYEAHNRMSLNYRDNGEQLYATDTFYGGGYDWGFVFSYGNRTGTDYRSGNSTRIPASYLNQNFLAQFGFDLPNDSQIEFRVNRLDQTDTEYAGQFFDVNYLKTDAFSVNYVNRDPCAAYSEWTVDSWYNQTAFEGDTLNVFGRTLNENNFQFNVIERVERALEIRAARPSTRRRPRCQWPACKHPARRTAVRGGRQSDSAAPSPNPD